jgi:hypothetical protein
LGKAFALPQQVKSAAIFPAVVLKVNDTICKWSHLCHVCTNWDNGDLSNTTRYIYYMLLQDLSKKCMISVYCFGS